MHCLRTGQHELHRLPAKGCLGFQTRTVSLVLMYFSLSDQSQQAKSFANVVTKLITVDSVCIACFEMLQ